MKRNSRYVSATTVCLLALFLSSALVLPGGLSPATEAARPVQSTSSVYGEWSPPMWVGFIPIHVSVLPTGKVLMWGRDTRFEFGVERDANDYSQSYVFDPATNGFVAYPFNSTTNLFCSGHSFLPDGRLFVAGGHDGDDGLGEPHTNIYDPATNTYSFGPLMSATRGGGRWYPTNTVLGNGLTLVTSGTNEDGQKNPIPQVLEANMTFRNLTGARDEFQRLYPMMLLAPDGRVFESGPNSFTRYLSTSGAGAWDNQHGIDTGAGLREYGTAVMFEDGRILLAGGGAPTNFTQTISLTRDPAVWQSAGFMQFERRQLNATLLPDGKVLVTGGTRIGFSDPAGAVYAAEMWDPDTSAWTTLASASRPRLYHSTAVLLPDGRVLTGGGGGLRPPDHSLDEPTIEIYSPPYLFKGPRPTITSAPSVVNHGSTIFVATPDAAGISKVTLVKLSSVTHAFNQNQRINTLSFVREAGGLTVRIPTTGNLCPPGHYMLFIVNSNGVPSVASMVQVTAQSTPGNAIDDTRFYVRQLYYDLFNREPDLGGWNGWSNYIYACGTDANCLKTRRVETARLMMSSTEFRRDKPALANPGTLEYNQEFVRQCYLVYLRRQPDANGYNSWLNYLNSTNDEWTVVHGFIYGGEYRRRFQKP